MRFDLHPSGSCDGEFDPARFRAYMARAEALASRAHATLESRRFGTCTVMQPAADSETRDCLPNERIRLGCVVLRHPATQPRLHLVERPEHLDQLSAVGSSIRRWQPGGRIEVFPTFQVR